jgi:prevent-host-death family protein
MASISIIEARKRFDDVVNRAAYGKERVLLTRRGRPLAAVVPVEDVKVLQAIEDRLDLDPARASLAEAQQEGTVPWEQIKADLGL